MVWLHQYKPSLHLLEYFESVRVCFSPTMLDGGISGNIIFVSGDLHTIIDNPLVHVVILATPAPVQIRNSIHLLKVFPSQSYNSTKVRWIQ